MQQLGRMAAVAAVLLGVSSVSSQRAEAIGLLLLEGSDAQTFHSLEPYSTNFLTGMATFSSAPTLPIAFFGALPSGSPTVGKVGLSGVLPTLTTMLANYSGLYLNALSICCNEPTISASDASIVAGFLAAGRSVAIENYQGGAVFDSIIGNTGAGATKANLHVAGLGGGDPITTSLGTCFDGNIVAAAGAPFFSQAVGTGVPNISCFGHQVYEAAFFDVFGLTFYIATNPALPAYNVVISNGGGGLAEAIPEPTTLALLGTGLLGITFARRRKAA